MKFKKLSPVVDYSFTTNLSVGHALTNLKKNIDTKGEISKPALFSKPAKPFSGKIEKDQFTITRIVRYNQTFVPIISGCVVADKDGTLIQLNMRLQAPVAAFMRFWIITILILSAATIAFIIYDNFFELSDLTPFLILFVGTLAFVLPFKYEVSKAKKIIEEVLKAEAH